MIRERYSQKKSKHQIVMLCVQKTLDPWLYVDTDFLVCNETRT